MLRLALGTLRLFPRAGALSAALGGALGLVACIGGGCGSGGGWGGAWRLGEQVVGVLK